MVARQGDFDQALGSRLEHFARLAVLAGAEQPEPIDGESERLAEDRQVDLQSVVLLERPIGTETQARLTSGQNGLDLADERAAMADRVAVGDFLVRVRL